MATGAQNRDVDLGRVQAKLDVWKNDLLDLTRRNKVLYFSSARGIRVQLTSPAVSDLYGAIVIEERELSFPTPRELSVEDAELGGESSAEDSTTEGSAAVRIGDIEVAFDGRWVKDINHLQTRLYRLRTDARSVISEQGVNVLHLGLGALEWRDATYSDVLVRTPLIFAPVELVRESGAAYKLKLYEGDVDLNPTLRYKLLHDFGIELPSLDPYDGFGEDPNLPAFFDLVRSTVESMGWEVFEESWLSLFSYQKLVMFEDLNKVGTAEAIAAHSVLSLLSEAETPEGSPVEALFDSTVERQFELPDSFPVMDADSSQLVVLGRVEKGENLVVQGPPGTGKSQTIVNLIANAVRKGKSVLFVSEKKAALDVVLRRLTNVGLGDLCLEMHSNKTNKRDIVADLNRALEEGVAGWSDDFETKLAERRTLRERLQAYVDALHEPRDGSDRSVFTVQGQLARLVGTQAVLADLPFPEGAKPSRTDEAVLIEAISAVGQSPVWRRSDVHPWRGARASDVLISPDVLRTGLQRVFDSGSRISETLMRISGFVGADFTRWGLGGLSRLVSFLDAVGSNEVTPNLALLAMSDEAFSHFAAIAQQFVEANDEWADAEDHVIASGAAALLDDPATTRGLLDRYAGYETLHLRALNSAYRGDRRLLRTTLGRKLDVPSALKALRSACAVLELAERTEGLEAAIGHLAAIDLGDGELETSLGWTANVRGFFTQGSIPSALLDAFKDAPERLREQATLAAGALKQDLATASAQVVQIDALFPDGLDGRRVTELPLHDLLARATVWRDNAAALREWEAYRVRRESANDLGLGPFLSECESVGVDGGELAPTLESALLRRWLLAAYRDSPALAQFDYDTQESLVSRFAKVDRELLALSCQAALRQAKARIPRPPPANEYQLLRKEHAKKKRHLPLRRLLPGLPHLLLGLKPCLLMSPLSVANYLPRGAFFFDLVVFDEASQVLPSDAVGAILRGAQTVVLGDSRQLPPTTFFQILDGDDEAEDDDAADAGAFESVLDICRGYLPEAYLRWHYRSRDDRLINFSNREFYSGRLVTFPPPVESDDSGVRYVYVSNGCYERGGSKTNVAEAEVIVDLVKQHLEQRPERSLGVMALSLAQRDAIDLELRRLRRDRPDLEPHFSEDRLEPLFVKNLEAVQGDERDDVIISVGYGPAEPGGQPHLNFGPVNREGGERRLNVAVTRARISTTIVSSMRPEQLDGVYASKNRGPKVLADYLKYASRNGRFETEAEATGEPESDFEQAVYDALTAVGLAVDCQVGTSGFRIDLAVRHPGMPERYILGVECDGVAYHSALTARDRDRLRQEILEELGWSIERIWSTDWIREPGTAVQRIRDRVETLRAMGASGIRVAPERVEQPAPLRAVATPMTAAESAVAEVAAPTAAIRFEDYAAYDVGRVYGAIWDHGTTELARQVQHLVELESPVHVEVALRRIARAYGYQRVGSRVRASLLQAIAAAKVTYGVKEVGSFLWSSEVGRVRPRANTVESARTPAEISQAELEAGLLEGLRLLGATPRPELTSSIGRAFGFGRTSADLGGRIDAALESLISAGQCVDTEGFVSLARR